MHKRLQTGCLTEAYQRISNEAPIKCVCNQFPCGNKAHLETTHLTLVREKNFSPETF